MWIHPSMTKTKVSLMKMIPQVMNRFKSLFNTFVYFFLDYLIIIVVIL